MTIVDLWVQHPTPRFLADEMFAPLWRWTGQRPPDAGLPPEATLAAMDAAGVDVAVLTAWYGPRGPLISNDDVLAMVRRYPDRFVGAASVDLSDPMAAVRELHRAVDAGCRALRIIPWLWGIPPNHRWYYPLYAACVDLGIPFLLQVGHTGPSRTWETGRPIPYLDDVALDFPELVVVAGHIGHPWTGEMVSLATKYENVYIDTSAYAAHRYPPELVTYLRGHGRRKVMFGSNYPMIAPAAALARLDDLGLDEETRELFLHGNAQRVLGLAAGGTTT